MDIELSPMQHAFFDLFFLDDSILLMDKWCIFPQILGTFLFQKFVLVFD